MINAQIVCGTGPDHVSIRTSLPSPCPNFCVENLCLTFNAAANTGEEYVRQHFPNLPIEVIPRPKTTSNFNRTA